MSCFKRIIRKHIPYGHNMNLKEGFKNFQLH